MTTRIGVDCGGTFTDLVFYDSDSAQTLVSKVPSTPGAMETGVLRAAASLGPEALTSARLFLSTEQQLRSTRFLKGRVPELGF